MPGKFLITGFADEAGVTIEEQMSVLKKNGVSYIEMRGVNGKNLLDWDDAALAEIKRKMDAEGFKLSAIGSPIGKSKITDPFEDVAERFKRAIHCAKFFGCKYIRAFSFFPPEDEPAEKYWDEAVRRVKTLTDMAEAEGLYYALENESLIYTDKLEPTVKFLEEIPSKALVLAFDPGNFIRNGVTPFPEAYEKLKRRIAYFHIKDARGEQFLPSGEGDANMSGLLTAAFGSGFNGFLSVEPHLSYMKELNKAQHFTVACNALKKAINEGLGENLPIVDINGLK